MNKTKERVPNSHHYTILKGYISSKTLNKGNFSIKINILNYNTEY